MSSGPAYHARTHLPGGTDPIDFGGASQTFTTYLECVLAGGPGAVPWALWPMDDAVGASVAVDVVGGRDLTRTASGSYPLFGQPGPFDGLPDQTAVEGANAATAARLARTLSSGEWNAVFGSASGYSIEAWVYPVASVASNILFMWDGNPGNNRIQLAFDSSRQVFARHGATVVGGVPASAIALATFSHVRFTHGTTTDTLYINGAVVDTDTATSGPATGTQTTILNSQASGGAYEFSPPARIADLALYAEVVTEFCDPQGAGGGPNLAQYLVPTTDGAGGWSWEYPTIDTFVNGA